jgi:hypothetical protein
VQRNLQREQPWRAPSVDGARRIPLWRRY